MLEISFFSKVNVFDKSNEIVQIVQKKDLIIQIEILTFFGRFWKQSKKNLSCIQKNKNIMKK